MLIELLKFLVCAILLVVISKYVLVKALRVLSESLKLKPKLVGEISGFATSVPELLSVIAASVAGLIGASVYNIISSNIINLAQYIFAVLLNKNGNSLKNKAIKIDLLLVLFTILIPAVMLIFRLQADIVATPFLFILFFVFYFVSHRSHKRFLEKEETVLAEVIIEEETNLGNRCFKAIVSTVLILLSGIALYIVCNFLGDTLTNLSNIFQVPQLILGVVLGFITSVPELITFFEAQIYYKKKGCNELGVVEATSNLLMSNIVNLYIILTLGTLIYYFIT